MTTRKRKPKLPTIRKTRVKLFGGPFDKGTLLMDSACSDKNANTFVFTVSGVTGHYAGTYGVLSWKPLEKE